MAGTGPDPGVISEREAELLREIERLKGELSAALKEGARLHVVAKKAHSGLMGRRNESEPPAVALTDLQVLALLAAAPVDASATPTAGGDVESVKAGHIAPWEYDSAQGLLRDALHGVPPSYSSRDMARSILARVLGLSPPPAPGAALRMRVEWAMGAGQRGEALRRRAERAGPLPYSMMAMSGEQAEQDDAGTRPDPGIAPLDGSEICRCGASLNEHRGVIGQYGCERTGCETFDKAGR